MAKARKTVPRTKVKPAARTKSKPKTRAKAVPVKSKGIKPRTAAKPARARAAMQLALPAAPRPLPANLPAYDDLPVRAGAPAGAAWGVFGEDDQVGTVNLLTPERVKQAAGFIRSGRVFALNLPINIPDPPIFTRGKHSHTIKQFNGFILDDYLDNFYPQASSQWDALCHVKHPALWRLQWRARQ